MARYQLRPVGVLDTDNGESITIADTDRWNSYQAWIASGNMPDPEAVVVVRRAEVIARLWGLIKERRQRCTEGGAKISISGVDRWVHTDLFSRTQWIGMVLLGAGLPAGLTWKTMSGDFVTLTPTIVQQVFAAILSKEAAAFARGEELRAAINGASDPLTVDITAGWPASYDDPLPIPEIP